MADEPDAPNEIVAETREVAARREAAEKAVSAKTKNWPMVGIGFGVGIGSAAVAAAVIYANRSRPKR